MVFLKVMVFVRVGGEAVHYAASYAVEGAAEVLHDVEGVDAHDGVLQVRLRDLQVGRVHVHGDAFDCVPFAFGDAVEIRPHGADFPALEHVA